VNGHRVRKSLGHAFLTYTLAKINKPAGIAGKGVMEVGFTAKILHAGVHHPGFGQRLIAVMVDPF